MQPTRTAAVTRYSIPIWFCSGWGLPCRLCYQRRGALLPHPFSFSALCFHASKNTAVVFSLWHFPSGFPGRPLTGILLQWSPDFPQRFHAAIAQPSGIMAFKLEIGLWQLPYQSANLLETVHINQSGNIVLTPVSLKSLHYRVSSVIKMTRHSNFIANLRQTLLNN